MLIKRFKYTHGPSVMTNYVTCKINVNYIQFRAIVFLFDINYLTNVKFNVFLPREFKTKFKYLLK